MPRSAWQQREMENTLSGKIKWVFILWLARRLPVCKVIVKSLGESLDRDLSLKEKIITKLHLFTCEACERYMKQVRFLHDAAYAHGERAELSRMRLSETAKQRLKETLKTVGGLAF